VKILNRKADEIYNQQKEKEARLYDQLMDKQRSMLDTEAEESEQRASLFGSHRNLDFRQSVEHRKEVLEEELHERLAKIMEKHRARRTNRLSAATHLSCSVQRESTT